jgi:hypothetical protein
MARRKRDRTGEKIEYGLKAGFGIILLLAFASGDISGFAQRVLALLFLVLGLAFVAALGFVGYSLYQRRGQSNFRSRFQHAWQDLHSRPLSASQRAATAYAPAPDADAGQSSEWDFASVRRALEQIDWYQFEKFCAALLKADGFAVERKGGARPDGGVDLIAEKAGTRTLIQCKHWRTWTVQEKTVRELLGSMTDFGVRQGSIYTLNRWTEPAAQFAARHNITLTGGHELAQRALIRLPQSALDDLLNSRIHHCPKCESPMILRTGAFEAFWGCSRFPGCRGKMNHSGAR